MNTLRIAFSLNGEPQSVEVPPYRTLLEVLREDLGLTGTKANCEEGECGVCTVLVDGKAVNACLLLAARVDGCSVTTIEGLREAGRLHRVQEALIRNGAIQCGYCTPGLALSLAAMLAAHPEAGPEELEEAVWGNLCRCTGYVNIRRAIRELAAP